MLRQYDVPDNPQHWTVVDVLPLNVVSFQCARLLSQRIVAVTGCTHRPWHYG
jgi:hypothetical protein